MAHHGMFPAERGDRMENPEITRLRKEIEEQARTLGLGATRAFPQGVVNDLDEGEIQFSVKGDPDREKVFINFGKSVDFIGMTPQQAIGLAQCLIKHARASMKSPVSIVLY